MTDAKNADTRPESLMPEISEFETQYFIQTRNEIDTEKRERNKLLNYAVLSVGAFSLALAQIEKSITLLMSPWALALYSPLLILISGLIAARRMKLRQIADRWVTLYDIVQNRNIAKGWTSLEEVVVKGLKGKRYLYEDLWLHVGLSGIVYGLIVMVVINLQKQGYYWWESLGILVVLVHFFVTLKWLLQPIQLRENGIDAGQSIREAGKHIKPLTNVSDALRLRE